MTDDLEESERIHCHEAAMRHAKVLDTAMSPDVRVELITQLLLRERKAALDLSAELIRQLQKRIESEHRAVESAMIICEHAHAVLSRTVVPLLEPAASLARIDRERRVAAELRFPAADLKKGTDTDG